MDSCFYFKTAENKERARSFFSLNHLLNVSYFESKYCHLFYTHLLLLLVLCWYFEGLLVLCQMSFILLLSSNIIIKSDLLSNRSLGVEFMYLFQSSSVGSEFR